MYDNFSLDYELHKEKECWKAILKSYGESLDVNICSMPTRQVCHDYIKGWFKILVDSGAALHYCSTHHVDLEFDNVLHNLKSMGIVFHCSDIKNHDLVIKNGLMPIKYSDPYVLAASYYIDKSRNEQIPDWVSRYRTVYARPEFTNYELAGRSSEMGLYVVKNIDYSKCWMGSIGLGGFCLFYEGMSEEQIEEKIRYIKSEGKTYWRNSVSLLEYLENTPAFARKDKIYGVDEILIMHNILPENIELIAWWNNQKSLIPLDGFSKYVKPEFQNKYLSVIRKYNLANS